MSVIGLPITIGLFLLAVTEGAYLNAKICFGETSSLSCLGQGRVEIVKASYGRSSSATCQTHNGNQLNTAETAVCPDNADVTARLWHHCLAKETCRNITSTSIWTGGNACLDTYNYLDIYYYCTGMTDCWDSDRNCKAWSLTGECQTNPTAMGANCKKSCGLCQPAVNVRDPPSVCVDDYKPNKCPGWAAKGECETNKKWMLLNCKKSCAVC